MGYPDANADGTTKYMKSVHGKSVTGGSFPTQIWQKYMAKATDGLDSCPFPRPAQAPATASTGPVVTGPTTSSTSTPPSTAPPQSTTTAPPPSTTTPTTTVDHHDDHHDAHHDGRGEASGLVPLVAPLPDPAGHR